MGDGFGKYAGEIEAGRKDSFLDCFKPLDSFTEEEARRIIPGWLPAEQITLLAADGGLGKTSLRVNVLSALSSGGSCILDPPGFTAETTVYRDPRPYLSMGKIPDGTAGNFFLPLDSKTPSVYNG